MRLYEIGCLSGVGRYARRQREEKLKFVICSSTVSPDLEGETSLKDINISYIRYFVTLVEQKKFNKAAYQLHISQPALSKSIMLLEDYLGTSLLKRYPKGFELTDAGKYFYETSVYFLKLYDDFLYDVDSRVCSPYSGTVRMSSSGVLLDMFYPDIILKLREQYPDIKIYAMEEDTNAAIQSLLSHRVDVSTAIQPLPPEIKNRFTTHPLMNSSFHIVLPTGHPLTCDSAVHVSSLDGMNILTPGEFSQVHQSFLNLCKENAVSPVITFSCSQLHLLFRLAAEGVGLAVLPDIFLRALPPGLTHRPLVPALPWNLILISPNNAFSLAVSTVISFVQNYFHSLDADGTG